MSDYGGIGDTMLRLMQVVAWGICAFVGAAIAIILILIGYKPAGLVVFAVGVAAGVVAAILVAREAA